MVRDQRERLLRAVVDVVGTVGYAAAAVEPIITRAAVSRRTFYEHFPDKEIAFLAAWDRSVDDLIGLVAAAAEGPPRGPAPADGASPGPDAAGAPATAPPADGGRALTAVEAMVEALIADPARARVVVVEVLAAGDEALGRRAAALDRLAAAIAGARADGATPHVGDVALAGGVLELVHDRVRRGAADELRALAPQLVALLTGAA